MPDKILHKRSLTSGSIPTTSSLSAGELAINVPDGKIYILKSGSAGQSVESAITSNSTSSIGTLLLSGSLILSGSTSINSGSVLDVSADNITFDFDYLSFSGSAEITGSLIVTRGITAASFTGSLLGTASFASTASYAQSSGDFVPGSASGSFGITIDGAGSTITTGEKGYVIVPYNGTITGWTIVADQSGNCVLDLWKTPGTIPTVADTITGTEKPTLSSQQIASNLALTSWTASISVGDVIAFNVDSASTITRVNLSIYVTKQ